MWKVKSENLDAIGPDCSSNVVEGFSCGLDSCGKFVYCGASQLCIRCLCGFSVDSQEAFVPIPVILFIALKLHLEILGIRQSSQVCTTRTL